MVDYYNVFFGAHIYRYTVNPAFDYSALFHNFWPLLAPRYQQSASHLECLLLFCVCFLYDESFELYTALKLNL